MKQVLIVFCLYLCVPLCYGFEIDKMILELSPSGENSKGKIKIKNTESHQRLITVEVSRRVFVGNKEEMKPTDQVVVDKSAIVLGPGKEETLNVEWKGKSPPRSTEAYRVILVEVKKDLDPVNSLKEPLVSYYTSVFVTPNAAVDAIQVRKAEINEASNKLILTLRNTGKKHRLFLNTALQIKDIKSQQILETLKDSPELQQLLLMPGQTKTVDISLNRQIKKKPITVSLKENE